MGALDLGARRKLRARCGGQAHQADAASPQLQRDHHRAYGHDLDHRQLFVGARAAVRRRLHAQPGRRYDA